MFKIFSMFKSFSRGRRRMQAHLGGLAMLVIPALGHAADCVESYNHHFFDHFQVGIPEGDRLSKLPEDARYLRDEIAGGTQVAPENMEAELGGPRTSLVGMCKTLPLLSESIADSKIETIWAFLYTAKSKFASLAADTGNILVLYPRAQNSYLAPACRQNIEHEKAAALSWLDREKGKSVGYDPAQQKYFVTLADKSPYFRDLRLSKSKDHLITLRVVETSLWEGYDFYEICAFPRASRR